MSVVEGLSVAEINTAIMSSKPNALPRTYECLTCGKVYKAKAGMQNHVRSEHNKERNHTCNLCSDTFFAKGILKGHIASVHNKERKYACNLCEKVYARKGHLDDHIRIGHNEERNHKCETCGEMFAYRHGLQTHIDVVHLGQLNFKCELCPRLFGQKVNLHAHQKTCGKKRTRITSGELECRKVLGDLNIKFEAEIQEIKTEFHKWLRFDFELFITTKKRCFIEFDGEQHFRPVRFGGISVESAQKTFERRCLLDVIKTQYCIDKSIHLVRIPYTQMDAIPAIIDATKNYLLSI